MIGAMLVMMHVCVSVKADQTTVHRRLRGNFLALFLTYIKVLFFLYRYGLPLLLEVDIFR